MHISVYNLITVILLIFSFLTTNAQIDKKPLTSQSPDTIVLLNDVSVVAYRVSGRLHTLPGSLEVINSDGLLISNGTQLATALNTLPGINMQTGTLTTSRIVIRGMGSRTPYNTNRIRAYLNDIPLTGSDGVSTPEEIDLLSLDKIEIIKGPSSALYGSGLGGSINMYSPEKKINEGNISAQYESYNTWKTHLSGTVNIGKANLWGNVSQLNSDGYRENNNYRRTSFISTAKWDYSQWSLNATLLLIDVNGGIPSSIGKSFLENTPAAAAPNWKAIGGFKKYTKGVAAISLNNKLHKRLSNQIIIFSRWNNNYEKRPFNNLDDQSFGGGIRNKLTYRTSNADLVFGTELLTEQYKWKLDQDSSRINENSERRNQVNLFAIGFYRPAKKLNISLAAAINYINYKLNDLYSANGDQSGTRKFPLLFSPRFGINYAFNDHFALFSSVGHGFSMPSPEETLLPAGDVNPDIRPETGIQYETGARLNMFEKALEIEGTLYWIELSDLLITKRITEDIFTGMNAGKTRHQGFELSIRNRWFDYNNFPGIVTSSLSYTRSINKFIDFTDNGTSYNGYHLPGIPDRQLNLQLNWGVLKIMEITSQFQYTGNQYITDDNSIKYSDYYLLNLKVSSQLKFKKSGTMTLYAGINNLSDTHYASMLVVNALGINNTEPRYYYPGLPRHGFAGVRFRL
jgi:iron complex outermembrane receptor protein